MIEILFLLLEIMGAFGIIGVAAYAIILVGMALFMIPFGISCIYYYLFVHNKEG